MEDVLLRKPFDHYARYKLAAEVVTATVGPDASVLDLGGGPGSLQAFLPDARVVSTDIVHPGEWHEQAPKLVLADGAALPFADDAFDAVVTLDTLEHVVPGSRTPFLHEVARVAKDWALVVCPFDTPGVADADAALRSYVANRFAPDLPTIRILDEHLGYGHPSLEASRELLAEHGPVATLPSGRLDRWFSGMLAFFHLLAIGNDEPVEVTQRFLNRTFYEVDLAEPSYRHALLLRTSPDGVDPSAVVQPFIDRAAAAPMADGSLDLLRVVLTESLVDGHREATAAARETNERLALTEEARAQAQAHADGLQTHLKALEAELDELRAFKERVQQHPLVRIRSFIRRLRNPRGM